MEPLFFKAENLRDGEISRAEWLIGFNGAAFFQSGKLRFRWPHNNLHLAASMEPLFFKAENGARHPSARTGYALQWSRFFSKRKTLILHPLIRGCQAASMEPLFFKAENGALPAGVTPAVVLASMEPLFFKAENGAPGITQGHRDVASMEPLFFKAENA